MNATLARKLSKVLESGIETQPDLVTALNNVSVFYEANTLAARRQLRGELERRALEAQEALVAAVERAHEALLAVEYASQEITQAADRLEQRLRQTQAQAGSLLERAAELQAARGRQQRQEQIAARFLSRFQLSAEEAQQLRSPSLEPGFFRVLERLRRMQVDCRALLRASTQHQQAGLELLEQLSLQLQGAQERLSRLVREACRERLESDHVELDETLPRAFQALQETHLVKLCLEEVEAVRSRVVLRRFLEAVSRAGPGPAARPAPLELRAHDPLRYAADMLAWLHQQLAEESELLNALFLPSPPPAPPSPPSPPSAAGAEGPGSAGGVALPRLLGRIFEGVTRPLQVRLEQLLAQRPGLVVVVRLASLLDFYQRLMARLLPAEAALVQLLSTQRHAALALFGEQLRAEAEALATQAGELRVGAELQAPQLVHEQAQRVRDIVQVLEASLVEPEEREALLAPVLRDLVEPCLQACLQLAARLALSDAALFLLNCLSAFLQQLDPPAPPASLQAGATTTITTTTTTAGGSGRTGGGALAAKREMLRAQVEAHLQTLVEEETARLLASSGLAPVLQLVHYHRGPEPLSSLPQMEPRALAPVLRHFEAALFESGALQLPQLDRLADPDLRRAARLQVAQLVASAYTALYQAVVDPRNKYDSPHLLLRYKPEQFALLCT
jgi:hypothetical protein